MPMNLLRRIEKATFPLAIHEDADIRYAEVLVATELIEANLPALGSASGRSGVILRITPMGRAEILRQQQGGQEAAGG